MVGITRSKVIYHLLSKVYSNAWKFAKMNGKTSEERRQVALQAQRKFLAKNYETKRMRSNEETYACLRIQSVAQSNHCLVSDADHFRHDPRWAEENGPEDHAKVRKVLAK